MVEIDSIPFFLVTANVGSVFEDPVRLLKPWVTEFLTKVELMKPQFIALHMQEVGGKTYEKSMDYVQEFIRILCESPVLAQYSRIRIYLDEDYNSAEHFTALGNLYFVHQSLHTVKIWNFLSHEWETVEGKSIYTGNIEAIPTKEKAKFPQHFFPECKWSRKGFLRTRWELNCTVVEFANIHLFHDASNLAACEHFPSVYCKTRRRALVHTLERFHRDEKNGVAPYFIFGDFNFRCDTEGVIKKLTEDLTKHRIQSAKTDSTKVQYRNADGLNVLTVAKKEFTHIDHQTKFKESWLQQFDRELEPLRELLVEYPITFPPSYPYEEDPEMPQNYMFTRCPAWCDRIVMSPTSRDLIVDDAFSSTDYNILGENMCMGDHKPVYLSIRIKTLQGTVSSCQCYKHADEYNVIELERNNLSNFEPKSVYCLYSSYEFLKILLECRKLDRAFDQDTPFRNSVAIEHVDKGKTMDPSENQKENSQKPLVSINVTDSDNLNVCMCSLYSSLDKELKSTDDSHLDGSICPECRNIIKKQPSEHRCTLISKRLMLGNNIIVNRIDTHYLTTYVDNRHEPYTPESAESHSPFPESESNSPNDLIGMEDNSLPNKNVQLYNTLLNTSSVSAAPNTTDSRDAILNTQDSRGVVSPRQLKSRLEHLQRTSLNSELDEVEYTQLKTKRWSNPCCCLA